MSKFYTTVPVRQFVKYNKKLEIFNNYLIFNYYAINLIHLGDGCCGYPSWHVNSLGTIINLSSLDFKGLFTCDGHSRTRSLACDPPHKSIPIDNN